MPALEACVTFCHCGAVKQLVIMGGNEAYNDWTTTGAEFNFWCDPDAAEMVIREVCVHACIMRTTLHV